MAIGRYKRAKSIIDELELGRKDMEMFLNLQEELISAGAEKPQVGLPKNWR